MTKQGGIHPEIIADFGDDFNLGGDFNSPTIPEDLVPKLNSSDTSPLLLQLNSSESDFKSLRKTTIAISE